MTYEEAKERFENFGTFCDDYNEACDGDCEKCSDMEDRILEALEKQSNIVHCKDCKNWGRSTPNGVLAEASGICYETGWLCGEQGYCMYGRKAE